MKDFPDFERFMAAVDAEVEKIADVSVYDLPDVMFVDYFEDCMSPKRVAKIALAGADY